MNFFLRLLCFTILLGLSACIFQPKVATNSQTLMQCKQVCLQHREACKKRCTNNCSACSMKANYTSARKYFNYVREMQIQGRFVMRNLKSYRDPLQCRKVTCNCALDFTTCNQGCTGIISKKLQSVPYCT